MSATERGVSIDDGSDGLRAGNTELPVIGSGDDLSTLDAPDAVDTASAFYRCRGFRPLELRDVGAVNALIQAKRRRKRRAQLWWLVLSLATASSVAFAGWMAWMAF